MPGKSVVSKKQEETPKPNKYFNFWKLLNRRNVSSKMFWNFSCVKIYPCENFEIPRLGKLILKLFFAIYCPGKSFS